jgi:dienelactone hydrolase
MADVLLLHHALGQTPSFQAFADALRAAGHTVATPDVYDGRTFDDLDEGLGYAREIGFDTVRERGVRAADELPERLVYIGISMGQMAAQQLAQTRPGAAGAVFISSAIPLGEFADTWPDGVPLQIHGTDADPFFVGEGDIEAARELVEAADDAELFMYPGDTHMLVEYDANSGDPNFRAVTERVLEFLQRV